MTDWKRDGKREFIELGDGDCKLRIEVYATSTSSPSRHPSTGEVLADEHQWTTRWQDANLASGSDGAKRDALICLMRLASAIRAFARSGEGYQPLFVAQQAYKAYGDHAEWKAWNGLPMPTWEVLDEAVRSHWVATCEALIKLLGHGVTGLNDDDELDAALKNVGVDIECAGCAAIFYTGVGFPHDEHTCDARHRSVPIRIPGSDEIVGWIKESAVAALRDTNSGFSIGSTLVPEIVPDLTDVQAAMQACQPDGPSKPE